MLKSGSCIHTVTTELFTTSDKRVIDMALAGRDPIAPLMNPPPVPQEASHLVVTHQVSSAGRKEVFLNPSKVRNLLDMRVLEGRGDLSVWLIKNQWSRSSPSQMDLSLIFEWLAFDWFPTFLALSPASPSFLTSLMSSTKVTMTPQMLIS